LIPFQPKHILVTGGAGFIGANFIYYLAQQHPDCLIVNLDNLTYASALANLKNLAHPHYHFIKGDICNGPLVTTLLTEFNIDTIVHFAAESHVDRSIHQPDTFIQANLVGTFTLLEAARKHFANQNNDPSRCRFHHVSTDEVFGSLGDAAPLTKETDVYLPNSPYSASKAGSDHLVRAYYHTYQLPYTMTHCANNYGPFQHAEKLIPTLLRSCKENKAIPIYGNGKNKRDWLYVEDHCSGILTVLQKGQIGESYNIGANNEWTNLDLAYKLCHLMDVAMPKPHPHEHLIQFVTDRPGHDWRYGLNTEKIQQLGWQPATSFDAGLEKTIAYFIPS